jgi:cytochrome c553
LGLPKNDHILAIPVQRLLPWPTILFPTKNMKGHGNAEVTENPDPGRGAPGLGLSEPGPAPLTISKPQNRTMTMKKILVLTLSVLGTVCLSASAADVKENWEKLCAKCHGAEGKGDTKMGQKLSIKDLTDAKLQADLKDDKAFKSVKEGIKDAEGKVKMKPAEGLSDDEIKALVAYVRGLKK